MDDSVFLFRVYDIDQMLNLNDRREFVVKDEKEKLLRTDFDAAFEFV